ncbi:hypothetical protein BT96DRAFT_1097981 [Gymnopus androsaceus JB14]|uniref:Uncharacterized protein n=1 Tax=Gymnopus androsaceus JB14 TaxID=1447944 RepID=A0A6A4HTW1_9AGAR|nr:hypothetical protein BT96DRAFT_1097981 [Gymnopus androsaceus JB14]
MTPDESWRYCRDDLRRQLRVAEAAGRPLSSRQVIQRLRDEEVEQQIHPSVASINAIVTIGKGMKRDDRAVAGVYTATQVNQPAEFAGTSTPQTPTKLNPR